MPEREPRHILEANVFIVKSIGVYSFFCRILSQVLSILYYKLLLRVERSLKRQWKDVILERSEGSMQKLDPSLDASVLLEDDEAKQWEYEKLRILSSLQNYKIANVAIMETS